MPENGWAMVWRRSDQYCRLPGRKKAEKTSGSIKLISIFFSVPRRTICGRPSGLADSFLFLDIYSVGGYSLPSLPIPDRRGSSFKEKTRENLKERQTQTDVSRQFIRAPNNLMQMTKNRSLPNV
jgi:hypothetical protein